MAEGFIVGDRLVYSAYYRLADGSALVLNLDREGNDLHGRTVHSDPKRRIVTVQSGEVILWKDAERTVARITAYRKCRLQPAVA